MVLSALYNLAGTAVNKIDERTSPAYKERRKNKHQQQQQTLTGSQQNLSLPNQYDPQPFPTSHNLTEIPPNATGNSDPDPVWDDEAIEYNEHGKRVIPGTPYTRTSVTEMIKGGDPKELATLIISVALLVLVLLMLIYQHRIVKWLEPVTKHLIGNGWGWLVPVAALIVLSIPPLIGHDIVLILVGVVWKVWPGWGIASFGTVVGEIVTWFFVQWLFTNKSNALKHTNLRFAAMSRICYEGGFIVILIFRLSFIPGHFITAVFAVSGVSFWVYFATAILTTPKLLIPVVLGQNFNQDENSRSTLSKVALGVTIAITVLATMHVSRKVGEAKEALIQEARKRTLDERRRNGRIQNV